MPDEPRKSPEEQDREWLEHVYQGDTPQLTIRAVLTGCLLGGIMSLSNLYVGLKSGWGMGVDVAAIILSFAIWKGLTSAFPRARQFNMMENAIMMTSAVAASWISSAGLIAPIPALTMVSGRTFIWWHLILWICGILLLGLFMAIPLKRQMITVESLRFPYNVSVVETLKAMYSRGSEAIRKALALGIAGAVGIVIATLRDAFGFLPPLWNFPFSTASVRLSNLTIGFEPGLMMAGIGALFGIKVGVSMLVAALLNYGVLGPYFINRDVIVHPAPVVRAVETPKFPLTIQAGQRFTAIIEEASLTHEMAAGSRADALTYTWTDSKTYGGIEALLTDLNSDRLADGAPNPLHNKIAFLDTLSKDVGAQVLWARALDNIHREARLTISPDTSALAAASPLGFRPGVSRFEAIGGFRNIVNWSMWSGAGFLVASGLLALAFQFKTMARTFTSIFAGFRKKKPDAATDILEHIEIPGSWFAGGFILTGIFCLLLQLLLFGIHWYMGVIAVLLTFFLAAVAARAGAEVGINPIGAMGKVTQLLYGVIAPGNMVTNLMTANVTAGAACSCADTVGNLYVGYKVGVHPRKQFVAQIFGVFAGALFAVPAYFILVPDANALGGAKFPAPSAIVWAGVARILSQGLHTIPVSARYAMLISIILAILIVVLERIFPKIRPFTPSCTAVGIALTIPAYNSIMMFLGAFIVWILEKRAPQMSETYSVPVASGAIAGESLAGVTIAGLMAAGVIG